MVYVPSNYRSQRNSNEKYLEKNTIEKIKIYRDPRQRLLAEQKQNSTPKVPGPEKLSFKEKMKMFAMETGEDGTPRDKVKISRAQRDIDNLASPLNNN